ncbi:ABC transporter substrate-binding protein [Arthrobacter sp. NPDC090010]|uniref:ABC transporter substrate-binding protein n=1 Tax=Arthrobacter sp. NPDC090010 TaxID=3363942 RepID=UPI00380B3836
MKRRFRVVGALALTALTLAGCSLPGADRYGLAVKQSELVSTTEPGSLPLDRLNWNLPYEPLSIDPMKSFNYAENTAIANMCESLLRLEPDMSVKPGLATKVTQPDPLTQVYTLRGDVTFWDGSPMTAQDVSYSLNRQLKPENGSYFAEYYTHVKSIEVSGPHEVTVRFTAPDALFRNAMATAAGAILQEKFTQAAGEKLGTPQGGLMCTGPYRFSSWQPGRELLLSRNDSYWDKSVPLHVKNLAFSFIADESTAVNALRSGEVDGQFFFLPPSGLIQLQKDDALTVNYGKSLVFFSLVSANGKGPFGDARIRQALSALVERSAIASVVLQGAALPTAIQATPDYWGYEKQAFADAAAKFSPDSDVALARKLLTEAGHTGPITIGIQGSSAVHEQTANIIQAAGRKLGLDIRTKVIPVEQYGNLYSDPKAREGLDGFFTTWYGNAPEPLEAYMMFVNGGRSNFSGYGAVSDAVQDATATLDPAARARKVIAIQDRVTRDAAWIPMVSLPTILVQGQRITGATASMSYLYYPWAVNIGGKGKK